MPDFHAAWLRSRRSDIDDAWNRTETPMNHFPPRELSRKLLPHVVAGLLALLALASAQPVLAADEPDAPKGAAVTVLKATKSCFSSIVEASGIILAREETAVRPDRPGLKVAAILAEPGDTVTSGQTLARLTLPEGGVTQLQAPVGGMVSNSTAVIGAVASGKGEALFSIIPRGDYDLVGMVPVQDIAKLAADQPARIRIVGAGEIDGKVRRVAPTVEPNSQLGQVWVSMTTNRRLLVNSAARAMITTGKSCNNVAVPLTAVLYGSAGTVVQVVRRERVETKSVQVGLMSAGQVEITSGLQEGDVVVARAGALLREGDPVRPVTAEAEK
jgi:multidrug efflux pump subunit AcrA (membrane-fusion protein)